MQYVDIVERDTREIVERMGPMNDRTAVRVASGARINLDHKNYMVIVTDAEVVEKAKRRAEYDKLKQEFEPQLEKANGS